MKTSTTILAMTTTAILALGFASISLAAKPLSKMSYSLYTLEQKRAAASRADQVTKDAIQGPTVALSVEKSSRTHLRPYSMRKRGGPAFYAH